MRIIGIYNMKRKKYEVLMLMLYCPKFNREQEIEPQRMLDNGRR